MISNTKFSPSPQSYSYNNQALNKYRNDRKITDFSNVDKIEISIDAMRASQKASAQVGLFEEPSELEEQFEDLLEEYNNSGVVKQADSPDDAIAAAGRMKMTAMKIAMRIAKGDNVPMQDHRFLAEYDAKLYKAAMQASVVADNDDPETHESLADELAALENALAQRDGLATEDETEIGSDIVSDDIDIEGENQTVDGAAV